jgi:hypothetical protein
LRDFPCATLLLGKAGIVTNAIAQRPNAQRLFMRPPKVGPPRYNKSWWPDQLRIHGSVVLAGSADQPPSGGNGNPHWHRTSQEMGDTGGRPGPQPRHRKAYRAPPAQGYSETGQAAPARRRPRAHATKVYRIALLHPSLSSSVPFFQ